MVGLRAHADDFAATPARTPSARLLKLPLDSFYFDYDTRHDEHLRAKDLLAFGALECVI